MAITRTPRTRFVLDNVVFDKVMVAKGWKSNAECAEALDVHQSTIARLRAGTCSPTYDVVRHMTKCLGVPADLLFIPEEES